MSRRLIHSRDSNPRCNLNLTNLGMWSRDQEKGWLRLTDPLYGMSSRCCGLTYVHSALSSPWRWESCTSQHLTRDSLLVTSEGNSGCQWLVASRSRLPSASSAPPRQGVSRAHVFMSVWRMKSWLLHSKILPRARWFPNSYRRFREMVTFCFAPKAIVMCLVGVGKCMILVRLGRLQGF